MTFITAESYTLFPQAYTPNTAESYTKYRSVRYTLPQSHTPNTVDSYTGFFYNAYSINLFNLLFSLEVFRVFLKFIRSLLIMKSSLYKN